MGAKLDTPPGAASGWARTIWRYRTDEIVKHRPVTAGDVFKTTVNVPTKQGPDAERVFIVLQHPCSIRIDGVNVRDGVLAAVVKRDGALSEWPADRIYNKMPLPELIPDSAAKSAGAPSESGPVAVKCWWADFDSLVIVSAEQLDPENRIAVMDLDGIALLLQRFAHFLTRAAVAKHIFVESVAGADAEVEVLEDWIGRAIDAGAKGTDAAHDCMRWLREDEGGGMRQAQLEDPATRKRIVREAALEAEHRYNGAG